MLNMQWSNKIESVSTRALTTYSAVCEDSSEAGGLELKSQLKLKLQSCEGKGV